MWFKKNVFVYKLYAIKRIPEIMTTFSKVNKVVKNSETIINWNINFIYLTF